MAAKPLKGIRVLDLTNVLAGPFCCLLPPVGTSGDRGDQDRDAGVGRSGALAGGWTRGWAVLRIWPVAEWEAELNAAGIPAGRVQGMREALDHPLFRQRDQIAEYELEGGR